MGNATALLEKINDALDGQSITNGGEGPTARIEQLLDEAGAQRVSSSLYRLPDGSQLACRGMCHWHRP
jgi:hypothetical protein